MNKYYSFSNPFGNDWVLWYLRESYTALLCANLPLTYPLIQRIFKLRNWNSYTGESHSIQAAGTRGTNTLGTARSHSHWVSQSKKSKTRSKHFRDDLRSAESQEDINDPFRNPSADTGPQFITSAIEMDGVENNSYEKSLTDFSIDSPMSWRTEEARKTDFNYNPSATWAKAIYFSSCSAAHLQHYQSDSRAHAELPMQLPKATLRGQRLTISPELR